MSDYPPPLPSEDELGTLGAWSRFKARPLWQRGAAYAGAAVLMLGVVGAISNRDDGHIAGVAPTPESTPAPSEQTESPTVGDTHTSFTDPTVAVAEPTTVPVAVTANESTALAPTTLSATEPAGSVLGALRALDVLALIPVENEHRGGYNRDLFGYPDDTDGDGCNTRAEVLQRDSLTPAQVDPFGCGVVAGDWLSPYDNVTWTDPAELQIDHVVALKEVWDSGGWQWDAARLVAYGNDLDDARTLRAVTGEVNIAKGDKDPSNWLPPYDGNVCPFLADWIAIKARWGLSMDQSEAGRIRNVVTDRCPDLTIAPWPSAPGPVVGQPVAPALPPLSTTDGDGCDPSYPTVCIPPPPPDLDCKDIPYRNFTVLPPDPHHFDSGKKNGIGCES